MTSVQYTSSPVAISSAAGLCGPHCPRGGGWCYLGELIANVSVVAVSLLASRKRRKASFLSPARRQLSNKYVQENGGLEWDGYYTTMSITRLMAVRCRADRRFEASSPGNVHAGKAGSRRWARALKSTRQNMFTHRASHAVRHLHTTRSCRNVQSYRKWYGIVLVTSRERNRFAR